MPLISVIIPVYNTEQHLNKCLNSVVNQTLKDIEIICINDNSSDNSLNILKEYKEKDKNNRIKIISLKTNKGASHARNIGIKLSTGKYISFIDSDDYIDQNFHHTLYTKALTTGADVVKGNRKIYKNSNEPHIEPLQHYIHENDNNKFLFEYQWTTAIYKKSVIDKYHIRLPENLCTAEDLVFLTNILLCSKNVEYVDEVFYHYIKRPNSLTNGAIDNLQAIKSRINASIMITQTLNENSCIAKKTDYIMLYSKNIKKVYECVFKIQDLQMKRYAIKALCRIFAECRHKNDVSARVFEHQGFLVSYLINNSVDDLVDILSSKSVTAQLFVALNKNVYRDLRHVI